MNACIKLDTVHTTFPVHLQQNDILLKIAQFDKWGHCPL